MDKFYGNEGQYIDDKAAEEIKESHVRKNIKDEKLVKSQFFGREILLEMLGREGVKGLRLSHGLCGVGKRNMVIEPLNAQGELVRRDRSAQKDASEGDSASDGPRCPKKC